MPRNKRDKPRLDFLVAGAQKSGTTALAHYLALHPGLIMAKPKEAHIFDTLKPDSGVSPEQIDSRYAPLFQSDTPPNASPSPSASASATPNTNPKAENLLYGEATPIYMYLEDIPEKMARYNPQLKIIVILRDPVERAISHYYMERSRQNEKLPLWLALLLEPYRLYRKASLASNLQASRRLHSYRSRGLYTRQLLRLHKYFDPKQILILCSKDLANDHKATLTRLFQFLDVSPSQIPEPVKLFVGDPIRSAHYFSRACLKLSYLAEYHRLSTHYGLRFS
ncbi:MAG: sulfotransferase [Pseudomonadales bacterium]|nr:sulfotransferase [Pseudomonadales bacterium]